MKRFYTQVTVGEGGHILLDGKPIKTPEGMVIAAPNVAVAEAMQQEWATQGDTIDWNQLPITRLAGGGQTLTPEEAERVRADLAGYVDTDMLCYWSEEGAVKALQQTHWQPVLDWVRQRFDCTLLVTHTITPIRQSAAAHQAVQHYLVMLDGMELVVFSRLCPLLGSVWLAMALHQGAVSVEAAVQAAQLDELFQALRWGEDAEATKVREAKAAEIRLLSGLFLMLGERA